MTPGVSSPEFEKPNVSRLQLARTLEQPLSVIKSLSEEVYAAYPECFVTSEEGLLELTPEAQDAVADRLPPDDGWIALSALKEILQYDLGPLTSAARRLSAEGTDYAGMLKRRRADGEDPHLFAHPDLASLITQALQNRKERERQREQQKRVDERFESFAEEMMQGESLDAQEFRKLVEIFGPDSCIDLLAQYRPDFTKVPVDMVASFLTDYLGSFLIAKGKLDLDNLTLTSEFLGNRVLKNSLIEVVKQHCHSFYQETVRDNPQEDDLTIISEHLQYLKQRIDGMDNDNLQDVLQAVDDFYTYLFVEIEKPENFIDSIVGDRPFPDLNQRINVGEMVYENKDRDVYQKRRMLIADEPGMGKSASAIMAKEHVQAKCALILSPSGMVETWKGYLSDAVGKDGAQIGYFTAGQAPRVLVVESVDDLQNVKQTDYDYIILSHGRLKPGYTDQLMDLGFDMLIVDEAHEFKNIQEGQMANELLRLSDYIGTVKDSYTLMLTATPAPNKVSDIAMMLRVLYPGRFVNEDGTTIDPKLLVRQIIKGDLIDLRSLLVPRMQRKLLTESLDMPDLVENTIELELSPEMQQIYELILEDDEMNSTEKIQRMRQFLNNPAALEATPDVESVKALAVGRHMRGCFETENKILMFVNDYVDNIISGEKTIHAALNIPPDVKVVTLTGSNDEKERSNARDEFQTSDGKMLLIVSGNIAGLGIDLSAADRLIFYNEPWNKSLRRQQVGRAYRPNRGKDRPLAVDTFYFPRTLEEGMLLYTAAKEVAIQKLLNGIKLTEIEQIALLKDEEATEDEAIHDINPELAAYYYSSWERMLRMFGYVKEIGEEDFVQKFLPDHGVEYAKTYRELANRSYQANAARLTGTLIANHFDARKKPPREVTILDIASGPEMLKMHMPEEWAPSVVSLDINPRHFDETGTKRVAGSMLRLPVRDASVDYVNFAFALHYSKQQVKKGVFERADSLAEINRVLKKGGRATITMIWSLDFDQPDKLEETLEQFGFQLSKRNSGEVQAGDNFKARLVTVEKIKDIPNYSESSNAQLQRMSAGLRLVKKEGRVKDTKKIVDEFWIKGQQRLKARLNRQDQEVLHEETTLLSQMYGLKKQHQDIKSIPAEDIIKGGFSRIFNGKKHILFKRLSSAIGAVVIR